MVMLWPQLCVISKYTYVKHSIRKWTRGLEFVTILRIEALMWVCNNAIPWTGTRFWKRGYWLLNIEYWISKSVVGWERMIAHVKEHTAYNFFLIEHDAHVNTWGGMANPPAPTLYLPPGAERPRTDGRWWRKTQMNVHARGVEAKVHKVEKSDHEGNSRVLWIEISYYCISVG